MVRHDRGAHAVSGQFLRYCLVGVIGYLVDAGVLEVLFRTGLVDLYGGRVVSYLCAASVTWWLHARFTFRASGSWAAFIVMNAIGAAVNYGVYAFILWLIPATRLMPSIAVAVGAVIALAVNFAANRFIVFRPGRQTG